MCPPEKLKEIYGAVTLLSILDDRSTELRILMMLTSQVYGQKQRPFDIHPLTQSITYFLIH